jgi:hypothetical protein
MKYKVRAYHKPGKLNQLEQKYANHLALLKAAGEIEDFAFEPEKLRIGDNCHYTPDFRVIKKEITKTVFKSHMLAPVGGHIDMGGEVLGIRENEDGNLEVITNGIIEFHEVKAAWKVKGKPGEVKPHYECDAMVKLKAAASGIHPYKFIMVWLDNGKWQQREIN